MSDSITKLIQSVGKKLTQKPKLQLQNKYELTNDYDDEDYDDEDEESQDQPEIQKSSLLQENELKQTQNFQINSLLRFNTRYQRIGETKCFFLSYYKNGRVPICTFGPSIGPSIFMILFSIFIFGYLGFLCLFFIDSHPNWAYFGFFCLILNYISFWMTMFGEQGVPQSVYERYYKLKYGQKIDQPQTQELTNLNQQSTIQAFQNKHDDIKNNDDVIEDKQENVDEESNQSKVTKRNNSQIKINREVQLLDDALYSPIRVTINNKNTIYCEKCDLYLDKKKNMIHCDDCQVCIEENDHHCMFYSKCIAKGNAFFFYLTFVILVFNFALIGFLALNFGNQNSPSVNLFNNNSQQVGQEQPSQTN